MNTRERAEAYLAKAEAATSGPWSWEGHRTDMGTRYQHILGVGQNNKSMGRGICDTWRHDPITLLGSEMVPATEGNEANAQFIASSRTEGEWAARKLLEALDIVSDLLWVAVNMHADEYEEVDRARQFLEGSDDE